MSVVSAGRPPSDPSAIDDELSFQFPMMRKRRSGFGVAESGATDESAAVGRDVSLCVKRGFHGPFRVDPGTTGSADVGTCSVCGLAIFVPDHQPAYEIARFHGLTP